VISRWTRLIDTLYQGYLLPQVFWRERRRWCQASRRVASPSMRVYYGYDHIPGTGEFLAGGLVKCQDLQRAFPNVVASPNLLYMVTSALPPFAVTMAREAKRAGAKIVVNQNGVGYPAWCPHDWQRVNRPMRKLLKLADHVIYQSRFCKESADRFLAPCSCPSEILHNPVDTSIFVPRTKRDTDKPLTLIIAGSYGVFYRIRKAVETLAILRQDIRNARLIIAGRYEWDSSRQDAGDKVLSLCRELKVAEAVDIRGTYTQEEAVPLFHEADILLHTKYNDPCPRIVAEAMACGLPVVYSASGGLSELVGDDAGSGIAAILDWNIEHPPSADLLATAVIKIWRQFDIFSGNARNRAVTMLDIHPWMFRHQSIFESLMRDDLI
jgi:glycosyltransferase involved in cell wall biosynthesis